MDRARQSLAIDIVGPLVDGRLLTGAVQWDDAPVAIGTHFEHLGILSGKPPAPSRWNS